MVRIYSQKDLFCQIKGDIHSYNFLSLIGKWSISVSEDILVDCRCFRSWSKWPFDVANVLWMSAWKLILSIPSHVIKLPLFINFWNIEITGEPAQACKYCASSNLDLFLCIINE